LPLRWEELAGPLEKHATGIVLLRILLLLLGGR
jgi:hypothetical protein